MVKFAFSRRMALHSMLQTCAVMAASTAASSLLASEGAVTRSVALGAPKFNNDGTPAYWPGNTIICHIDRRSATFAALLDIHAALMRSGLTHRLAVLPPASYHMTVFEGIAFAQRNNYYPSDLPLDASEEACNQAMLEKLRAFDLGSKLPFRMRPLTLAEQTNASAIWLAPSDAQEERKLRGLRDRLADTLKMKAPNHDSYRFHITLNYLIEKMDQAETARFAALRRTLLADFIARSPVVELRHPEFTFFDDMFAFRPQLLLDSGGGKLPVVAYSEACSTIPLPNL